MKCAFMFSILAAIIASTPIPSIAKENTALCSTLKSLLDLSFDKGLGRSRLESFVNSNHEEQYLNLDLDSDDINDTVIGGCYGSLTPSDPCDLSIDLSSGKKTKFTFKYNEKFYLSRYRSRIFAISSPSSIVADEKTGEAKAVPISQIRGHRTIYILDSSGINKICERL